MALHRHDVDGLLEDLNPNELAEWQAFDFIEPIGEHRADWRNAALICAVGRFLAGMFGELADLNERDFMPFVFHDADPKERIHEDDPALIFARLEALSTGFNR